MPNPAVRSNSENGGPGGRSPPIEVRLTIQPRRRSRMAGNTSWVRWSGATTCISNMSFTRRSGNSSNGRKKVTAASFTRMSGCPTCSTTSATRRSRSSLLERSACTGTAVPPAAADLLAGLPQRAHVGRVGLHRAGGDGHGRTLRSQSLGDGLAQPPAGAGYQRDLSLAVPGQLTLPSELGHSTWMAGIELDLGGSGAAPGGGRDRGHPPPDGRGLGSHLRSHHDHRPIDGPW